MFGSANKRCGYFGIYYLMVGFSGKFLVVIITVVLCILSKVQLLRLKGDLELSMVHENDFVFSDPKGKWSNCIK
jgi:hypothetical protein